MEAHLIGQYLLVPIDKDLGGVILVEIETELPAFRVYRYTGVEENIPIRAIILHCIIKVDMVQVRQFSKAMNSLTGSIRISRINSKAHTIEFQKRIIP
jgi:hypothetical protein